MKRKNTILLAVVGVLVVGTIAVASQSGMLAGRFGVFGPTLYSYEGEAVSVVVTPVATVSTSEVTSEVISEVTSEVTSEVVSEGGVSEVTSEVTSEVPSEVTSEVPSVVVTPVASPVTVTEEAAAKVKIDKLKKLTSKILKDLEKLDFKKNPKRYILDDAQVERLMELYEDMKVERN